MQSGKQQFEFWGKRLGLGVVSGVEWPMDNLPAGCVRDLIWACVWRTGIIFVDRRLNWHRLYNPAQQRQSSVETIELVCPIVILNVPSTHLTELSKKKKLTSLVSYSLLSASMQGVIWMRV